MINPQLEDGYTRIAHEILENMARVKLSPTQYRILFVVWRYTYGFGRKYHHLSLSFLEDATGCDKRSLQREVKKMLDMRILLQKPDKRQTRLLGFNKRFSEWGGGETAIGETANGNSAGGGETANARGGETANSRGGETANQDIKKIIDNDDDDKQHFRQTITLFTELFGPPNSTHLAMIDSFIEDGLTMWHIHEALLRAAEANATHPNYIKRILNSWVKEQAFTKEAVERIEERHQRQRQRQEHSEGGPGDDWLASIYLPEED